MDANLLTNLAAYSAQVACIAAAGSLLPAILRIDAAAVRYTYWRALLALCLLLPWIQGRATAPLADAVTGVAFTLSAVGLPVAPAAAASNAPIDWLPIVAAVLAGGILLRAIWIGVSLMRLRRLRTAGRTVPMCEEHREIQWILGTRAEIRYVTGLGQPVTFGALRPVVLLPESLRDHPPPIQRAVLFHELFHVQRRDWIWVLAEEAVRSVLWFHPGVWWLVSRIQLAREEAVDELAVLATGQRRTYIEALVAFADATPLAPAAAFARRRHLFRRVMLISKETVMSARRVVLSCAVMAALVMAGSWFVVGAFPLMQPNSLQAMAQGPGPLETRANPITPENPVPRRTYAAPVPYPPEAAGTAARATVRLRVTLDESGLVAEARYDPPRMFSVSAGRGGRRGGPEVDAAGGQRQVIIAPEDPAARATLEPFIRSAIDAVRQWQYDAPANGPISFNITLSFLPGSDAILIAQDMSFNVASAARLAVPPPPPPPPPPPSSRSAPAGAVRVGGGTAPTPIRHVPPVYPPMALAAKVQGAVVLEARIEPDGRVGEVQVLRSIPLLDQAAIDAVRQWAYTPTLLNGQPVPVVMTVTVQFSLRPEVERVPAIFEAATPARTSSTVQKPGNGVSAPRATRQVKPEYTAEAMDQRIEGTVLLSVVVRADGSVGDVNVTQSLDSVYGLDAMAVEAMKQWEFTPGTKDGQPVDVAVTVEMTFTLK